MTHRASHPSRARGFTLIELLVVVCIIGMLIAILVPATMAVFEFSKLIECRNNMGQIAKAALQYSAVNDWIVPAVQIQNGDNSIIGNIYDRPHWCNLLVEGGFIDAPDTSSLADSNSQQSTTKDNVFRCPSGLDQICKVTGTYPVGTTAYGYADDEVMGFIRVGRTGKKIDCGYYWNGSTDKTYDATTGRIVAWDFPSMAVPLAMAMNPLSPSSLTDLKMSDVQANPYLGMHKLESMTSVSHGSVASNVKSATPGLLITTSGNMTTTIMLTDGVGLDAGDTNTALSLSRISAPHGSEYGKRTVTNVAYWDGHVEQGNCTRPKVVPPDTTWQTKDTAIWTHPGLRGANLGIGHFRLSDGASQ